MKKLIALGLMVVMILSLAACGASAPKEMELKEFEKPISITNTSWGGKLDLMGYSLGEFMTDNNKLVGNGLFVYGQYTNVSSKPSSFSGSFIDIIALQRGKVLESFAPIFPEGYDAIPGGFEKMGTKVDKNISYMIGTGFRLEDRSPVTVRISTTFSSKEVIIDPEGENKDTGK